MAAQYTFAAGLETAIESELAADEEQIGELYDAGRARAPKWQRPSVRARKQNRG
jgi:hypothetical protein